MRIIAGLFCIVLIVGCSDKDKVPSGVLDKEEMGNVLWDMMQADQYAANYLVKDSSRVNVKMETLKLYEEVFRLHKITRDEFRKSFHYYQDHPDITRTMFDSLIAKGNRLRSESYLHPSNPTPSVPAVKPPVIGPKGPVAAPGAQRYKRPAAMPVRAPGVISDKPTGGLPNHPGGMRLPARSLMDSLRFRRKGAPFQPRKDPAAAVGKKADTVRH
jgi:hypothetical protein